jgi:hypothetical protein
MISSTRVDQRLPDDRDDDESDISGSGSGANFVLVAVSKSMKKSQQKGWSLC